MSPAAISDLVFDALGNPLRRDILRLLGDGPKSVADIASAFPVSRPAVSRHLSLMLEAGLVEMRIEGTRHLYALREAGFAETRDWLDRFWTDAEARLKLLARNTEPKG